MLREVSGWQGAVWKQSTFVAIPICVCVPHHRKNWRQGGIFVPTPPQSYPICLNDKAAIGSAKSPSSACTLIECHPIAKLLFQRAAQRYIETANLPMPPSLQGKRWQKDACQISKVELETASPEYTLIHQDQVQRGVMGV